MPSIAGRFDYMSTIPTFKNAVWTGLDIAIRGWGYRRDGFRRKMRREQKRKER